MSNLLGKIKERYSEGESYDFSMHEIEELEVIFKQAEKYRKLENQWFDSIDCKDETIFFIRKCKEVIEDFEIPVRTSME